MQIFIRTFIYVYLCSVVLEILKLTVLNCKNTSFLKYNHTKEFEQNYILCVFGLRAHFSLTAKYYITTIVTPSEFTGLKFENAVSDIMFNTSLLLCIGNSTKVYLNQYMVLWSQPFYRRGPLKNLWQVTNYLDYIKKPFF